MGANGLNRLPEGIRFGAPDVVIGNFRVYKVDRKIIKLIKSLMTTCRTILLSPREPFTNQRKENKQSLISKR